MNGDMINLKNFIMIGLMAYLFIYVFNALLRRVGKPQFTIS
jgi:hypothetical protein